METSTTIAAAAPSGRSSEAEVAPKPSQPFAWRASNGRDRARRRRGEGGWRAPRRAGRTGPEEPSILAGSERIAARLVGECSPYPGLIEPDVIEMRRVMARADRRLAGNVAEREVHAVALLAKCRWFAEEGGHSVGA